MEEEEQSPGRKVAIAAGIIFAIIIVLLIIWLAYYFSKKGSGASSGSGSSTGSGASSGSGSGSGSGGKSAGSTGFIYVDAGPGYAHGFTKDDAAKRCAQFANGRLATKDEITKAHDRGFEACSIGWWSDGAALIMQKGGPGCGGPGVNIIPAAATSRYSALCYGSSSDPADKVIVV